MNQLFNYINRISRVEFTVFWCCVLVQSLAWSKFLLSVSLWALAIISVFTFKILVKSSETSESSAKNRIWFDLKPTSARQYFSNFWQNKALVALTIPFLLVLFSGFYSENIGYWLERTRIKVPFLILPLAFANLPPLSKKQFPTIFCVFLIAFSLFCGRHLFFYYQHFEDVNHGLSQGIPIPTNWNHISFGMMTVFAFLGGLELLTAQYYSEKKIQRILIGLLTAFLFVSIHILSVRSAILTLYICLIIKLLALIFYEKKWIVGLISFIILTTIPFIAYRTIPSLKQRINYAIWDFDQYERGDMAQKSDSERIISLQMGIKTFQKYPIFGVGYGDIMDKIGEEYAQYFPKLQVREPHSFWLFSLTGTGIVGTLLFLMAFATHWFYEKRYRILLFSLLHFLILLTNTIDFVVEGTYGAVFYAFFVAVFLCQKVENTEGASVLL